MTDTQRKSSTTNGRASERRAVALPARLTWKDPSGAVRFVSVVARNLSEAGAFVEPEGGAPLPIYRIVHVQLERTARELEGIPAELRQGSVMSAIWRVSSTTRGVPGGYALRFLVEPRNRSALAIEAMAAAS